MENTLFKKLIEIQTELIAPKNLENKFGGYMYRSCESILEAVKPLLKSKGLYLLLTDKIINIGERYYIEATSTISDGENSISVSALAREADVKKGMDDAQITGACSSYARKYALNGLFCIDDIKDADVTNNHEKETEKSKETKVTFATFEQKKALKEKIGASEFAKIMNRNGGQLTNQQFNELMKG